MRMNRTLGAALVFAIGLAAGGSLTTVIAQKKTPAVECGASTAAQVRTTLYFGSARPKGSVSELEWQLFLRDDVTSRFPNGLTVWDAEGQWRAPQGSVEHERTKVLLIVHPDTPAARESVQAVIERYRTLFEQQSVLWETARVCIAA
jgi:Protein of unknown function (DUF3574)